MSTSQRILPIQLAVVGSELAIAWNDGLESYLKLEMLRRSCPCAVCQGEADVMGLVDRPSPEYTDASFRLRSIHPVGGYAVQAHWEDGHQSGLFSFSYLKTLGEPDANPSR